MGAFEYTTQCNDCNHLWSGMWFSFNAESVARGMYEKNACPICKSENTQETTLGNGGLQW